MLVRFNVIWEESLIALEKKKKNVAARFAREEIDGSNRDSLGEFFEMDAHVRHAKLDIER